MQKLIDINDASLMEQGMFPSVAPNQQQLWKDGKNIEFGALKVRKALGYTVESATTTPVYAIAQAFIDGNRRAYFAETSQISMWQNGLTTVIGSGFSAGFWSLETWGTFLLATNEVDAPKIYKNTGSIVDLGGLTGLRAGRKYRIFKKHMNHMFGYFGQTADWSQESDVETWVPSTANAAGSMFIRDLDSDIIAACPLGPDMALYSTDSMVLQKYVGAPLYFGFEKAISGVGAVSDSSVQPFGNRNFGMSLKGFWETDGVSVNWIDNPQIRKWVTDRFYTPLSRRVVGVHDEEKDMMKWWFPGTAGTIYGVGYNYKDNSWTILDEPVTAASTKQVFDHGLVGSSTGFGYLSGVNAGASPLLSELKSFPLSCGDRTLFKKWDMLELDFTGTGLEVRFGFSDKPDADPDWTGWFAVTSENWIDRESVFLTIDFRSTVLDSDWELSGLAVHGERTGYRI